MEILLFENGMGAWEPGHVVVKNHKSLYQLIHVLIPTRWAPTIVINLVIINPYKWPYKMGFPGVITLLIGVVTQFITIVGAHLVVVDFFIYLIYWLFTKRERERAKYYIFYIQNLDA